MPTEAQRVAVDEDLDDFIMSSGTDAEIAADHGVSTGYVRERRRVRRRDLYSAPIRTLVVELAQFSAWQGTHEGLLIRLLDAAIASTKRKAQP